MLEELQRYVNQKICLLAGNFKKYVDQKVGKGSVENVVTNQNITMTPASTSYTYTGTGGTATLPPVAGNTGVRIYVINSGTGALNLVTNAGADEIMDSGTMVDTLSIDPGETYVFYNNSLAYVAIA